MKDKQRVIDMAQVGEVAKRVELEAACWREVTSKRFVEQQTLGEELHLQGKHKADGHRDTSCNQIVVVARFGLAAFGASDCDQKIAEAGGTLALRYRIADGDVDSIAPELVQDFAELNGIYNAWPYWRELAQNLMARIGLYGIVVPVFRIASDENEERPNDDVRHETNSTEARNS